MDLFERAARGKLRFASSVGELAAEQLWELPLTAKSAERPDLDKLARGVSAELRSLTEDSFVAVKPDPRKDGLTLQLDILKRVIEVKMAEKAAAEKAAELAERKRKLLAALSAKEESELAGMSREQIEAEIAKLAA